MKHFYEFENFRVETEKRLLWKNDEAIRLKPKTFEMLLFLLENRHKVITKDKIIGEIWSGTAVSDDSLTQQISQIRKILEDKKHRFIATVPGVGYEFIADVREIVTQDGDYSAVAKENSKISNRAVVQTDGLKFYSESADKNTINPAQAELPKTFPGKIKQTDWRIWAAVFAAFSLIGILTVFFWQR